MSTVTPQDIADTLYGLARAHGTAFILVDRFAEVPLQDAIDAAGMPAKPDWLPLHDKLFDEEPQRSPALLALHHQQPGHMALLDRSVALAIAQAQTPDSLRSLCGWLFVDGDTRLLQHALRQRLQAVDANGRSAYLRYFDPRVLPRLMQLLGESAHSAWIAPVATWCHLGRDGAWIQYNCTRPCTARSQRLTVTQAQAVGRIQLVNQVATGLHRHGLPYGHDRDSDIDTALQQANLAGLLADDDLIAYALYAMRVGPAFTDHQSLPEWVRRAKASALPFDDVVAAAWNISNEN